METDFLASGNHHFVPIAQIALLLEAVFPSRGNILCTNPLLRPVATDILFSGNYILSFKIFFFLEKIVFFNFFKHWFEWKQLFGPMKLYFWTNPSFWLMETDFQLTTDLVLLFGAFSLLVDIIFEIRHNQFPSTFSAPDILEAVFPASRNGFFIECFIPASENGFSV